MLPLLSSKSSAYKHQVERTIASAKTKRVNLSILHSIIYDDLKNDEIIYLLAKWRDANNYWFPTPFDKITFGGTKKWLKKCVLDIPDRLLFFVYFNGEPIGHMGVNRFTYNMKQAEVDNVIRGESPRGSKGIMTKALEELLRYMYGKLHILEPHVRTRTTNHRALDLYYRCGFQTEKKDNREIELVIPHYQDFKVFDL